MAVTCAQLLVTEGNKKLPRMKSGPSVLGAGPRVPRPVRGRPPGRPWSVGPGTALGEWSGTAGSTPGSGRPAAAPKNKRGPHNMPADRTEGSELPAPRVLPSRWRPQSVG